MKSITALVDHPLTWAQPKGMKSFYELRFGGEVVATMHFPKMLSSMAVGESSDGKWEFERKGIFEVRISAQDPERGTETVFFTPRVFKGGGIVQTESGKKLELVQNVWRSIFLLKTETGEILFEMKSRGFFKHFVDVQMNRRSASYPELPCLVMLVFYIILMARRDAAVHSAVH